MHKQDCIYIILIETFFAGLHNDIDIDSDNNTSIKITIKINVIIIMITMSNMNTSKLHTNIYMHA
jgi:hypothetical protein